MSEKDLRTLARLQSCKPPPVSPRLLSSVRSMRPARTRVPLRTLVVVATASLVFPLVALMLKPLRIDLGALPPLWVGAVALVWLTGFVLPLVFVMVPPQGQILPDSTRAGRVALLACLTLVLMGLLFTVDTPGATILPKTTWDGFLDKWWHCSSFSLLVSLPTIVVASVVLRWVAVAHPWRLGAAVGAAAGSLSGLTLHGLCPLGGGLHVGLAHGGGVVLGAVLCAIVLAVLVRYFWSGA